MLYYRYTDKNTPMSDWGHAMFVDDPYKTASYGDYCWTLDSKHCTPIENIRQLIIDTWEYDKKHGFSGDFYYNCDCDYFAQFSGEEIYKMLNPADIVKSAEGWDSDLVVWFWERIAEPNDIMAVSTQDGAVCYDEKLIQRWEKDDEE